MNRGLVFCAARITTTGQSPILTRAYGLRATSPEADALRRQPRPGMAVAGAFDKAIAHCSRAPGDRPGLSLQRIATGAEAWEASGRIDKARADFRKAKLLLKRPCSPFRGNALSTSLIQGSFDVPDGLSYRFGAGRVSSEGSRFHPV